MGEGSPGVEWENGASNLRSDQDPSGIECQQRVWAMGSNAGSGSGCGQIRSEKGGNQGGFKEATRDLGLGPKSGRDLERRVGRVEGPGRWPLWLGQSR